MREEKQDKLNRRLLQLVLGLAVLLIALVAIAIATATVARLKLNPIAEAPNGPRR